MLRTSERSIAAWVAGLAIVASCGLAWAQETAAPAETTEAAPAAADANAPAKTEGETPAAAPAATESPAEAPKDANAVPAAEGDAAAKPAAESATEGKKLPQLWRDFAQYIRISRFDLAMSFGQAILDAKPTALDVYMLINTTPDWQQVVRRASGQKELAPLIAEISKMGEAGYEKVHEDPDQIAKAIELLGQGIRQFETGATRLKESGEFAMIQLVQKLRSPDTSEDLKAKIVAVMPRLGKDAVRPLLEALESDTPSLVQSACTVIGQIGYPQAAPMLKELLAKPNLAPNVRDAATVALKACMPEAASMSVPQLYMDLARKYYNNAESLQPSASSDKGNVWMWKSDLGLTYKPVPRSIFMDVYAMRYARTALQHDANLSSAVSLWIAAGLRRAAELPAGAKDPLVEANQPGPAFYALTSGAAILQDVLSMGLKDKDVPVIVGAIESLARIAGARNLVQPTGTGVQPLVSALSYSDGRVRFLAAVTLASALPQERFTGCEGVVQVLNDALRSNDVKRAMVLSDDRELGNTLKGLARAAGLEVVEAADASKAVAEAGKAGGVDVLLLGAKADPTTVVGVVRDAAFANQPAIIVTDAAAKVRQIVGEGKRVNILPLASKPDAITQAVTAQVKPGGKDASEDQGAKWAIRAAEVIRLLGITGNRVIDVMPTVGPLGALLKDAKTEVRLAGASALAAIKDQAAQQAIAALALAEGDEKVRVAVFGLATESVRQFGNMLTAEQAKAVLDIVSGQGSAELRDAAAQLAGALNLPSSQVKTLILQTGNND